jgi:hypothetical protein
MTLALHAVLSCDRCERDVKMNDVDGEQEARERMADLDGWNEDEDGWDVCPECWAKWEANHRSASPESTGRGSPLQ